MAVTTTSPLEPPEILEASLAFPDAQVALDGTVQSTASAFQSCSWYGPNVNSFLGCYAIVNADSDIEDLVGDRLRLVHGAKSVNVYCFTTISDIDEDILISRRAYAALELLAKTPIDVIVKVLTG